MIDLHNLYAVFVDRRDVSKAVVVSLAKDTSCCVGCRSTVSSEPRSTEDRLQVSESPLCAFDPPVIVSVSPVRDLATCRDGCVLVRGLSIQLDLGYSCFSRDFMAVGSGVLGLNASSVIFYQFHTRAWRELPHPGTALNHWTFISSGADLIYGLDYERRVHLFDSKILTWTQLLPRSAGGEIIHLLPFGTRLFATVWKPGSRLYDIDEYDFGNSCRPWKRVVENSFFENSADRRQILQLEPTNLVLSSACPTAFECYLFGLVGFGVIFTLGYVIWIS